MGREIKRVPLDFNWPLDRPWGGYDNPYRWAAVECAACGGAGYGPEARHLKDRWYGYVPFHPSETGSVPFASDHPSIVKRAQRNLVITSAQELFHVETERLAAIFNSKWQHHLDQGDVDALVEAGRLTGLVNHLGRSPTAREVNDWSVATGHLGHDSINFYYCAVAWCERHGAQSTCAVCGGEGSRYVTPELKRMAEEWVGIEPPSGDAYQLWQTVSDGPISPPFATPEELARWSADHPWGGDEGASYETWLAFIRGPGWAPSLVVDERGVRSGVKAVVDP